MFQAILTVLCYFFGGIKASIIFNLLWWTWTADWIFYLYCLIFNFRGNRKDWLQPFRGHVRWAFWTPVGLMQLIFKGKENISAQEGKPVSIYRIIKPFPLILQTLIGMLIVIIIYFI
jgi:peptidoglycan/LPS O-acetylase OafA/YrhL